MPYFLPPISGFFFIEDIKAKITRKIPNVAYPLEKVELFMLRVVKRIKNLSKSNQCFSIRASQREESEK